MTETRPPDLAALPLWSSPAVDLAVTPPRRVWPAPQPATDPADLFSGPRQTPGRRSTPRVAHQDPGVDWALVASLRQAAAKELSAVLDAGVDLRDVQIAARHADPRTTMRYDRARKNLDRHPNYILAAYMASGT